MPFDAGAIVSNLNLDLSDFSAAVVRAGGVAAGLPDVGEILARGLTRAVSLAQEFASFVKESFFEVAKEARSMGLEAEKAGVSVEFLSTVGKAAGGVEAVGDALKFLNKNLADATAGGPEGERLAGVFAKLGISAADLQSAMSRNDIQGLFLKASDGMKGLGSSAEKTRVAMELFGRGGVDIVPALSKGSVALQAMGKDIADLGGGVDASEVKLAKSFGKVQGIVSTAWQGIEKAVAEPILEAFGEHAAELTETIKTLAAEVRAGVSAAMSALAPIVAGIWEQFKGLANLVGSVLGPAFAILLPILKAVAEVLGFIMKTVGAVLGAIGDVVHGVTDFFGITDPVARAADEKAKEAGAGVGGVVVQNVNVAAIDPHQASSVMAAKIAPQIQAAQQKQKEQIAAAAQHATVKRAIQGKR